MTIMMIEDRISDKNRCVQLGNSRLLDGESLRADDAGSRFKHVWILMPYVLIHRPHSYWVMGGEQSSTVARHARLPTTSEQGSADHLSQD